MPGKVRRIERAMRGVAWLLLASCAVGVAWSLAASERVDETDVPRMARAQLAYLGDGLEPRADAMQRLFPEGRVFMLALYGAAWVNVGLHAANAAEHARAESECQRSLALLEAPVSRRGFGPAGGLPNGMFYEAWTHWVRGGCVSLALPPERTGPLFAELERSCTRLSGALREHGPFVESYAGQAWPADTVVGVAGLSRCANWFGDEYRVTAAHWLTAVRPLLDPKTGLLPHSAHSRGARGSSSALMNAFLPDVDRAFAREQYALFRGHFSGRLLGVLPSVREYPDGQDGSADIDSGPLLFGVSGPATVVGIAAARANGDSATSLAWRRSAEAIGFGFELDGRRRYGFGLLPIGEAFLAFSSVAEPRAVERAAAPASNDGDRVRFRLLCTGLLCGLAVGAAWLLRRSAIADLFGRKGPG